MALIIRPNSGINNAMAGIAAGFGQGMQLGMESQKIQLAREKQEAELRFAEQRAARELAAEERAKTEFGQRRELYAQGQEERAASKEAMGYLAEAEGARTSLPNLPDQTGKFSYEFNTPQQSNQYTGMPINPVNAMLGKFANQAQYKGVLDNYNKQMTMAGKLASKMDPQTAQIFIKEKERQSLLMADESARQSFSSMLVDQRGRGFFQTYTPTGEAVEDPQITARLESLLEQSQNRNVPLQTTQQIYDKLLEEVGKAKLKAQDFKFQMNRFDAAIANSEQMGQQSQALAFQALKNNYQIDPNISPQQMSLNIEKANQGMIGVTINGKTEWVNAATAKEDVARLQAESDQMRAYERENADLRNQLLQKNIGLTEAQTKYTAGRNQGVNQYQAQQLAIQQWRALGEDGQFQVIEAGGTPQEWIAQQAAQLMSGGGMMPAGASAGAAAGGMGAANTPFTGGGAARPMMNVPVNVQENIRRTLDEAGITDPKQRQIAAGQILRGEWGARKEAKVVPGEAPMSTPPVTPPTAPEKAKAPSPAEVEQANAGLARLQVLKAKKDKTLAEEVEFNRLTKNEFEYQSTLGQSKQAQYEQFKAQKALTDRQAKIQQNVLDAERFLTEKRYSSGSARKELFGVPQTQEEFDLMMEYASESQGASSYLDEIGLIGQVKGYDVSKWSKQIRVLSPEDLAIAKKALASKSSKESFNANDQEKPRSSGAAASELGLVPSGQLREASWVNKYAMKEGPPSLGVAPQVIEQQKRNEMQTQYSQRVLAMSESELKKELVDLYGYDVTDLQEFLKQYGSEDIKLALAQIGPQSVGVGAAPKASEQTQKNINETHRAQQAKLRNQLNARLRNQRRK
jgi:hypothetical protein